MKFSRNQDLLGNATVEHLAQTKIILFGVGGVGSWCAEALIRLGVTHLTLVDPDTVCETNINRQLQATVPNIGKLKVEALKERLLQINPSAQIELLPIAYNLETSPQFNFNQYDYVIDAIDSLSHKVGLLAQAMESECTLFSSMGAANKVDPSQIRTASIWDSKGCRLARFVRKRLRRRGAQGECLCVYSEEILAIQQEDEPLGSLVHITATFGFHLAGLVVQDLFSNRHQPQK